MKSNCCKINIAVFLAFFYTICFSSQLAGAADIRQVDRWDKQITNGVLYSHYKLKIDGKPLHVYVTWIKLSSPHLQVSPILANNRLDSLETVSSMAERTGALVAINGSFFNRSNTNPFPVGFIMMNGRTVYFSHEHRSAFGLTERKIPLFGYPTTKGIIYIEKTGDYFELKGMNRKRCNNDALVYSPEYGERTGTNKHGVEITIANDVVVGESDGDSVIPANGFVISLHGENRRYAEWLSLGDRVRLYFVVDPAWLDVYNALTGGPLLIRGGRIVVEKSAKEKLRQGANRRIPLTAVGSTLEGRLMFVVADGRRSNYSVGVTYDEMAQFMRSIGAINAIGMDGGGSSTMVINGEIVNRPSGGAPRRVSNGIGVFTGSPF